MSTTTQGERGWAFNEKGRLEITLGVCGDAQEGDFMNATLQSTWNEKNLDFSIATHVKVPDHILTEEDLAEYLGEIFLQVVREHPSVSVEIQLGPFGNGEEDDD